MSGNDGMIISCMGTEVYSESDTKAIRTSAAISPDGSEAAIMASYFIDHPSIDGSGTEKKAVELEFEWEGFASENGVEAEYRLLDAEHNLDVAIKEVFFGPAEAHVLHLPLYTTVLIRLKKRS